MSENPTMDAIETFIAAISEHHDRSSSRKYGLLLLDAAKSLDTAIEARVLEAIARHWENYHDDT